MKKEIEKLIVLDYSTAIAHAFDFDLNCGLNVHEFMQENGLEPDDCVFMINKEIEFIDHSIDECEGCEFNVNGEYCKEEPEEFERDLNDLLNEKRSMLGELIDFTEAYDREAHGVEHEIEALNNEIKDLEDYLQEVEDNPTEGLCECPFCKIEMLEEENENLFDENLQLIERLQEKDKEINDLKEQLADQSSTSEYLFKKLKVKIPTR